MVARSEHRPALSLALGGGGARGLAHLGVVEVLQDAGHRIQQIAGVSIGSLAGALCAGSENIHDVQSRVIGYLTSQDFVTGQAALFQTAPQADEPAVSGLFAWYHQFRRYLGARRKLTGLFRSSALLKSEVLADIINHLLPDIDIADLTSPLKVVALDLLSGRRIVLTQGPLRKAVMASAAIPGVFPPVPWNSMLLCDLGVLDALPVNVAQTGNCDLTVAVDVGADLEPIDACPSALDVFLRLSDLGEPLVREYTRRLADVVIRPHVANQPWFDFSDPARLVDCGRKAALQSISTLRPRRTLRPHLDVRSVS
jgi:NTE family protein